METVPVRQTVSKREKGLSVPDAAMLIKLAEGWDVPVSKLLGSDIETEEKSDTLAEQLSSINEQLAKKQMRKNGMESDCFHCGRYCCCLHFAHYFCEDFCFFTEATEFKRRNASHCGSRWDRISN